MRQQLPTLLLALAVLLPATVHGQAREVRIKFLAFNEDISRFLIKYEDMAQGTTIQEREMGTNKTKKGYYVEDRAGEFKRIKRLKKYRYKVEGHVDQVGPKERHTVMGAPDGHRGYNILIKRENRFGVLGTIPLKKDESGKVYAKAMLKEVAWTPNGKQILVVVNQKIERPDGIEDVDDVHFMRFRPWKVKWLPPPPPQEEEEVNE